jgi:hypothetical protein
MTTESTWPRYRIALLVTGKGEEKFLPKLFRSLQAEGHCTFRVARWVPQLPPLPSVRQKAEKPKTVGSDKGVRRRDEELGLAARKCFVDGYHFVILVDDLEHDRSHRAAEVFQRYRSAYDTILTSEDHRARASIHFLVNMLEAYYFAHTEAVNSVLGTDLKDFDEDVETIRHPKNELKRLCPGFDEIVHGRRIVEHLDVERVLSDPAACRWLRTLFGWCSRAIGREFTDVYQLKEGQYSDVTKHQIDALTSLAS